MIESVVQQKSETDRHRVAGAIRTIRQILGVKDE